MGNRNDIFNVLNRVRHGDIHVDDAYNQLSDLFLGPAMTGNDELSEYGEHHRADCERIKQALINNGFPDAGLDDALSLWSEYSDSYAAGWMGLPDDEQDIYDCVKRHIKLFN